MSLIDKFPNRPDIEMKSYKVMSRGGFGLWWMALLPSAYTDDGDLRMYVVLSALAYALVVITGFIAIGYFKALRDSYPNDQARKRAWQGYLITVPVGAAMFKLWPHYIHEEPWIAALEGALLFIGIMALFTYLMEFRGTRRGREVQEWHSRCTDHCGFGH